MLKNVYEGDTGGMILLCSLEGKACRMEQRFINRRIKRNETKFPKLDQGGNMDCLNETAYCGIYCQDCMHYRNNYSIYAQRLVDELQKIEFLEYAKIDSGFRASFKNYEKFIDVLSSLAATKCDKTCRVGGGCSGKPCKIMDCCISKGYKGCWECNEIDKCNKFDILTPVCGDMPKDNLRIIKINGIEGWKRLRNKFYIWKNRCCPYG